TEVAGTGERRDDDDARARSAAAHLGRDLQAGEQRHLDVGEQHVGLQLRDETERGDAVLRVPDDLDVRLEGEQRTERACDEALVFRDDDADQRALSGASGSVTTSRVPPSFRRSSEPPCDSTRSRIPLKPLPSLDDAPTPSSSISKRHASPTAARRSRTAWARACRTTLVTASRIASARTLSCAGARRTSSASQSTRSPADASTSRAREISSEMPAPR